MSDEKCAQCSKKFDEIPFTCKFCGETFCTDHRLPENHGCLGLERYKENQIKSLGKKKTAQPIEYFYHKNPHTPKKTKKKQVMPYIIITIAALTMIAAFAFDQIPLYYVSLILILGALIKLFMPQFNA